MRMLLLASALLLIASACSKVSTHTDEANAPSLNVVVNTNANAGNAKTIDLMNTNAQNANLGHTDVPTSVAVVITSAGFAPATVTVSVGGTVTWWNDDTAPHQPASDSRSSRTTLPRFDSISGISQGTSYSYTFAKAGTFPYYDRLTPTLTGTVVVQ